MRQIRIFVPLIFLLSLLTCCGLFSDLSDENSVLLYYPASERHGVRSEALGSEPFLWEGAQSDAPLAALTRLLLSPDSTALKALFSPDIEVVSLRVENGLAEALFSEEYQQLDGLDKTLAEAAITMTLCQFDGIDFVSISADSALASTPNLLTASDFIFDDLSLRPVARVLHLYFADESGPYLIQESRTLILRENESTERYVLGELLAGPSQSSGLFPTLTGSLSPTSVTTEREVCYVSFPHSFWENIPASAIQQRMVLCSLVNSLCSLSNTEIKSVQLLMDHAPQAYYGVFNVSRPLQPDMLSVTTETEYGEGTPLSLYYPSGRGNGYVEIPTLILPRENTLPEIQALETLFAHAPPLGLSSPIPPDLTLQGFSQTDQTFTVDLQYAHSAAVLTNAFQCMVLTLTHRYPDMTVQFTLNGVPVFDDPLPRNTDMLLGS